MEGCTGFRVGLEDNSERSSTMKRNNGVTYDFVLSYSACLAGVLSVFVGEFPTGRRAGTSAVV